MLMIKHKPVLPPEFIYPIDDWRLVEKRLAPKYLAQAETVFSTANGYLGLRGAFEEGMPVCNHGTFLNGFYESWSIPYGEKAYGFAETGQTIVNVPDAKIIRLYVDDEPFDLASANILHYERALDLRAGTLDRSVLWETPAGRQILVESRRLVSFHEKHVAAIRYRVTVRNAEAALVVSSEVTTHPAEQTRPDDPRLGRLFDSPVLQTRIAEAREQRLLFAYVTRSSGMSMACGVEHTIETACRFNSKEFHGDGTGQVVFSIDAEEEQPITLTKYITYHTSRSDKCAELRARADRTLDRVVAHGFDRLLADQRAYLDDFWERSDVQVTGIHPRCQQCLRWNLFQLIQAVGRADFAGIPARGLTAQTYDGHYFWDMEMYLMPFLTYTAPRLARNVLRYRYSILDQARRRARQVNQKGALFPWRTINGEEASAYYAAGTAQYHINAAVSHALMKYVEITGDRAFLHECGAEILVETARLWYDLGFFSERQGGKFCIHSVTGPDEYATVVNNNTYTNLMARENLRYAVAVVNELKEHHPDVYQFLVHRTQFDPQEAEDWQRAADLMYVPFDDRLGVHPQDDSFLDRKVWDFEHTPANRYPLLLYYHPLVIYRHQVIKQADIVLAMFLLSHEFTVDQKKRNFDYYDPLTTGDSSLSACIQSIVAAEIGYDESALDYFKYALLVDLANVGGNVKDGCRIASMGGTWMAVVYGLAGLRDHGGKLVFNPRPLVQKLRFTLTVRGQRIEVDIADGQVTYTLVRGQGLTIWHQNDLIELTEGKPMCRTLP
jgi:alpha,alpha-trehalose phosphorylase